MRIHLIAVGGAIMHNLALALQQNGHFVTGSDDEIYDPARSRLLAKGLLPDEMGWDEERITKDLDLVIVGMHARKGNPEIEKANELGLKVTSFPAFIYEHSRNKQRIVVAGSHGKTTTTSMVMHALKYWDLDFDYLVGAQLEGFENMVRLSDAPIMVIEGDEYLSAAFDRRPKFLHYKPNLAIITGIAWDHINVFPEFEGYVEQFRMFLSSVEEEGKVFYAETDKLLTEICRSGPNTFPYQAFDFSYKNDKTVISWEGKSYEFPFFGLHNMENLSGACRLCNELGMTTEAFLEALQDFKGASKRMQLLVNKDGKLVYKDFAHAPSKVKASVRAVRNRFPHKHLVACVELHTFSSLNPAFHSEYNGAFEGVDDAIIFYNDHTLKMKKMPPIDPEELREKVGYPGLHVINQRSQLENLLLSRPKNNVVYLMMSSGTFQGLDLEAL